MRWEEDILHHTRVGVVAGLHRYFQQHINYARSRMGKIKSFLQSHSRKQKSS